MQTLSLVYTRLHGIPLGRADRPFVGWYGDMEMRSHAWRLLKSGPLDVRIRVGAPVPLSSFVDRKDLARRSEAEVREHVVRILRARGPQEPLSIVAPEATAPRAATFEQRAGRKVGLEAAATAPGRKLDKSCRECCHPARIDGARA